MISRIMLHKNTLLFAALSAALWGTTAQAVNAAVVASLKPLGFIASAIADGVTETQVLLPDGASEHDYSLRPSDVKRLQNADLVVWIGPEMEAFMQKSAKQVAGEKHHCQTAAYSGNAPEGVFEAEQQSTCHYCQ